MMSTLIASGPRPAPSRSGALASVLVHGVLIALVLGAAHANAPSRHTPLVPSIIYVPGTRVPVPIPPSRTFSRSLPPYSGTARIVAPRVIVDGLPSLDIHVPAIAEVITPPANDFESGGARGPAGPLHGDVSGGVPLDGSPFTDRQVERAVQPLQVSPPRYPDQLRSAGMSGTVRVRFIVSADGRVERGSIVIVDSPHEAFSEAVRRSLLDTHYRAAEAGGRAVRQLVEQSFSFMLSR